MKISWTLGCLAFAQGVVLHWAGQQIFGIALNLFRLWDRKTVTFPLNGTEWQLDWLRNLVSCETQRFHTLFSISLAKPQATCCTVGEHIVNSRQTKGLLGAKWCIALKMELDAGPVLCLILEQAWTLNSLLVARVEDHPAQTHCAVGAHVSSL